MSKHPETTGYFLAHMGVLDTMSLYQQLLIAPKRGPRA
jgi:hypothetical protein